MQEITSYQQALKDKSNHENILSPFIESFRRWRTKGDKHPVYDFLFSYYSFSSGQLLRWSPGYGNRIMANEQESETLISDWPLHYKRSSSQIHIDSKTFPDHRIKFLDWGATFLTNSLNRAPVFHCFGLHEWAMVYRTDKRHHPQLNLRISDRCLEEVVEANQLCCTHYDAFRFFAPRAVERNKQYLEKNSIPENEQPGCIHANMDLYKFAYKIAPFVSSSLLLKLFILAKRAREIDMRASPYDLARFEMLPIRIETPTGKEEYIEEQKDIFQEAQLLRRDLLDVFSGLLLIKKYRSEEGLAFREN